MNDYTKTTLSVKIIASFNILMTTSAGLLLTPWLLMRIHESPIIIGALITLIIWVLFSNIAMLFLKEAGRRSFLVFLWLLVLSLNFFLIFQTAPFFIDKASEASRPAAILLYIIFLLPCGLEIVLLANPNTVRLFSPSSSK